MSRTTWAAALAGLAFCGALVMAARPEAAGGQATPPVRTADYDGLSQRYCATCHSSRLQTANLVLEGRDLKNIVADAAIWEKVIRKLKTGSMPPAGMPRPDAATLDGFRHHLERTLDAAAAANPNPGTIVAHRLNRVEYANAIRDLLDVSVDAASLLPADDAADGFDNMANALGVPPSLLERYVSASATVARLAVGDPNPARTSITLRPRPDTSQNTHIEGTPVGTLGGVMTEVTLPADGEYEFRSRLMRTVQDQTKGLEEERALEVSIDGVRVNLTRFGGQEDFARAAENQAAFTAELDTKRFVFRVPMTAGRHTIAVAFLRRPPGLSAELAREIGRTSIDFNNQNGFPHLYSTTMVGPYNPTGPGDTASRRRIFSCQPATAAEESVCARQILTRLATRAYRRALTSADTTRLMTFYRQGREAATFDKGIEMGIRRIISGPEFIFRVDPIGTASTGTAPYRIQDVELASRLSFFLWSTIPDDPLLDLALKGRLRDARVFDQQVKRLLTHENADALVRNFFGQWLQLRNVRGIVPDPERFPDVDDNLRQAFIRETELFVGSIMRDDRSVVEMLTADYTFLNERLATHYGVPGVYGDYFRRVTMRSDERRGVLGQASILTATSQATRTSPVQRGKFVLENILGTPPPDPPAEATAMSSLEDSKSAATQTMRERMQAHRANPACAQCHRVLDPIGFSLENFDAVGRWRTQEGGAVIDPADTGFDGTRIEGAPGLRAFLLKRQDSFVETFTEKLLAYAIGRPLAASDMPAVRSILRAAATQNYKLSAIVLGVVNSPPFQMRMRQPEGDRPAGVPTASAGPAARR